MQARKRKRTFDDLHTGVTLEEAVTRTGGIKKLARAIVKGQVVQAGNGIDATYFFQTRATCQRGLGESSDSASSAGMQNDTGTSTPGLRDPEAHAQVSLADNDFTALAEPLSDLKAIARHLQRLLTWVADPPR